MKGKGFGNKFFILGLVFCLMILMSAMSISILASENSNIASDGLNITSHANAKSLKEGIHVLSSDLNLTRTDYNISIAVEDVSRIGRYTEATAEGKKLLFGYPDAWSSYTTIKIDGNDYYQDTAMDLNVTQMPTIIGDGIITKWALPPNVDVSQDLTLMPNTTQYRLTVTNNDHASHSIKIRYMFDTKLADKDGAPFRVPGVGDITTEQEFINPVFDYWQATDSLANPTLASNCTFVPGKKPYKVQFAYWGAIFDVPFDYTISEGRDITSDTAVGMYWDLGTLVPDETKDVVVYYGTALFNITKVEIIELFTEFDNYRPSQTVSIFADIGNGGDAPLIDGQLAINITNPEGEIVFESVSDVTINPDQIISRSFTYNLPRNALGGVYTINATIYDAEMNLLHQKGATFSVYPIIDIKINEIMFDPFGKGIGNEWIEIYNKGPETENIDSWVISKGTGEIVATLPNWDLPANSYLVVYFGTGSDDGDFSDGSGSFYTGTNVEIFDNTEDEVALYSGSPSASSIVDFFSWCSDLNYKMGQAHDYAADAGIWDFGDYFDIGFPTGKSIWDGNSIGRDKSSSDTNQPGDWDSTGGADAYYPTPGAKNTGPLYSVDDGIKLTQLLINLRLMHWEYQVTYANHTILEEYQTDDETYVKANHYFEANLDEIENTFMGVGEYHWYKINSSAWKEEITYLLFSPDSSESFLVDYTKKSVTSGLDRTINENITDIHSYGVFEANTTYQETCFSSAVTTVTQTDTNRYHIEIIQQVDDRGVLWNVSFVKDEVVSYANAEGWTTLYLTNNVEEPATISTHYHMSLGEGWLDGGIGDLSVNYEDYSIILGNKTFRLDGPGYIRMEKVSDSRLDIVSNIQILNVDNISETLDLGGSGNIELLNIGGEEVVKGYFTGNTVPQICQFYIDGNVGAGIGAFACGATGFLISTYFTAPGEATNPIGWGTLIGRLVITGGAAAVCALVGNALEKDKTKPDISFKYVDSGSYATYGWYKFKVTVEDKSDISSVVIKVDRTTPGYDKVLLTKLPINNARYIFVYKNEKSPCEFEFTILNPMCKTAHYVVTTTAKDNSAGKNVGTKPYFPAVRASDCTLIKKTEPKYGDKNIQPMKIDTVRVMKFAPVIESRPVVPNSVRWSIDKTIFEIMPTADMRYGVCYYVKIEAGATSERGTRLRKPFLLEFTTQEKPKGE
jgi:hypothetical protein